MAVQTKTIEKPWRELSPDEKLQRRLAAWLAAPGIKFATPEAEADYKARVTRLIDAILLEKTPDRVPVTPSFGEFGATYCGYSPKDIMYDVDKAIEVANRCTLDFQFDAKIGAGGAFAQQGRVNEILDNRLYSWPGHGVPDDGSFQFNEGEYMMADEYDAIILDPSDYWWRTYLPRVLGATGALANLMPLAQVNFNNVTRFGVPAVQTALEKLMQAGREALAWGEKATAANRKLTELGFPDTQGIGAGMGHAGPPFDYFADILRGTRGVMRDMLQQPDKLLEAIDSATKRKIYEIRHSPDYTRLGSCPVSGFALHKGADGWMSDKQFRTFYWPSLRRVSLALIEEGFLVRPFAEGGFNSRLEAIRDLPKGRVIWHFDYTDMARAKEVLGDVACLQGNVPVALIQFGTPEQVEDYCKKLIDTAGKGGGFILATGAGLARNSKAENVRAMVRCAKEYGVY